MVRKLSEVCSIILRSWEDQCWTCLERSVKAIKRQDNAERPAVPGCRRREGRMRYHSREVRAGRRTGPCGTTFLLWMDHLNPGGSRGAAGVGGAGHNLAKFSQDPSLAVWGAEEMGSMETKGVSATVSLCDFHPQFPQCDICWIQKYLFPFQNPWMVSCADEKLLPALVEVAVPAGSDDGSSGNTGMETNVCLWHGAW